MLDVGFTFDVSAVVVSDVDRVLQPYPKTIKKQKALLEGPIADEEHDYLSFKVYAKVIADHILVHTAWPVGFGIFAKWRAGKVCL